MFLTLSYTIQKKYLIFGKKKQMIFYQGESTTVSLGYWGGNIKIIRTIDGRWAVETGIGTPDASFSHGTTYRLRKQ